MIAIIIWAACLLIGKIGYHVWAGATRIDVCYNAAMILSGMGPVIEIQKAGGKIFSSLYVLFCGVVFITTIGVMLAPAFRRLFHRLHLEES